MDQLILCFVLTIIASGRALEIKKEIEKSCSVLTDKGEIDLSSVAKTDGQNAAFYTDIAGVGSPFYFWNPCQDTLLASYQSCSSGEMFQIQDNPGCMTIATKDTSSFSTYQDHVRLDYTSNNQDSHVKLVCPSEYIVTDDTNPFKLDDTCDGGALCFTLTHKVCCFTNVQPTAAPHSKGGLSSGSILLIIVLVLAVVYLIAGVLVMKFVKGAHGSELVPNVGFWKGLPLYVKDGVMFLVRGCKTEGTYESM